MYKYSFTSSVNNERHTVAGVLELGQIYSLDFTGLEITRHDSQEFGQIRLK